ncbi:hypothetical protein LVJ94_03650 [Pendulispora rubella]|uniref:Lipoprotein n=1 Tax=Pendulispora rubella TaxID=2741070 RepID=A0ABZ2L7K6_9BACT
MSKFVLSCLPRFLGSSLLLGGALAGGCSQSEPLCRTGTGTYTVKYTLLSGGGACANLKADVLLVNSYMDIGDDGKPALETFPAALTPMALAKLVDEAQKRLALDPRADVDTDPTHHTYAAGRFTTDEPQRDFCDIPRPSPVIQQLPHLPAVPADPANQKPGLPEKAATFISYEFSDWHVYFTPAHAGNQFRIHLRYTVDGDTCEYDGRAALFGARTSCDFGDGTPYPLACDAEAHPEAKLADGTVLFLGSGVDPDFPVECDRDTLLCVLSRDPPALE